MNPDLSQLTEFAKGNTWGSIFPEISLGILAVVLLLLEVALSPSRRRLIPAVAIWGQVLILFNWLFSVLGSCGADFQMQLLPGSFSFNDC